MTLRILIILTAALLYGGAAHADTLDLSSLPAGNLGSSASVAGATFEGIGSSNISNQSSNYFQDSGGAICAQKRTGSNCKGSMNINFDSTVKKLTFASAGYKSGDSATIVLYHNHQVVGTSGFSWNGKVNLTAWTNVTRLKIEYVGVGDGMAIGKFNYTVKEGHAVNKPDLQALNASAAAGGKGKKVGTVEGGKGSARDSK